MAQKGNMMLDVTDDSRIKYAAIDSIIERMDGFLYRCRNDKSYTMMFMAGDVRLLTGHDAQAFLGTHGRSYAEQTHQADLEAVYAAVDAALATRRNWHVDYRIVRPDGTDRWVHEIGGGVFEGEDLMYLEGIVVDRDAARRAELGNQRLLNGISEKSRLLLQSAVPIVDVLRTLRILAINARLEAGRAGPMGASFGFVAHEVSRLAEETAVLAEAISTITGELNKLLAAG